MANVHVGHRGSATPRRVPFSEEEHEIVLTEEEPVAGKRAVPKERVRLSKDTVTDEREVSEEVRKEQIESEGATRR
jgi:stress response protein YsnF